MRAAKIERCISSDETSVRCYRPVSAGAAVCARLDAGVRVAAEFHHIKAEWSLLVKLSSIIGVNLSQAAAGPYELNGAKMEISNPNLYGTFGLINKGERCLRPCETCGSGN
jgi:hypothetical protein